MSGTRDVRNGHGYVGQDEILRAVVNRAIQGAAGLDKRVTNPLQVAKLPHDRRIQERK
jgi:hypothetical protein